MLPFTTEVFFSVFQRYNIAIWPIQPFAYALGLLSVYLVIKRHGLSDKFIAAFLAGSWIWMGAVYHMMYFAPINWAAWLFGAMFVLQGLIFAWQGILRGRLSFQFRSDLFSWIGLCFVFFSMVVYPILGIAGGHRWPRLPMFGVAPCPTTIFTLGMLLMVVPRVPIHLLVVPVFWSMICGTAAWFLNVPEDMSLLLAGLLGLVAVQLKNRSVLQRGESAAN